MGPESPEFIMKAGFSRTQCSIDSSNINEKYPTSIYVSYKKDSISISVISGKEGDLIMFKINPIRPSGPDVSYMSCDSLNKVEYGKTNNQDNTDSFWMF